MIQVKRVHESVQACGISQGLLLVSCQLLRIRSWCWVADGEKHLELSLRLAEADYYGGPRPNWKVMVMAVNTSPLVAIDIVLC